MPIFSFGIHRTSSEDSLEHCVGDLVRISETTKGKGAGCTGTVQKITKVFTFILPEDSRGEVRAMHRFIDIVKKRQSDLSEFRVRTEEDMAKRTRQVERQERSDQAERTRKEEERQERSDQAERTRKAEERQERS